MAAIIGFVRIDNKDNQPRIEKLKMKVEDGTIMLYMGRYMVYGIG